MHCSLMFSILLFDQISPHKQQTTDPKYSIYNDLIGKICPLDDNVHKILKVAGTCERLQEHVIVYTENS